MNNAVIVNGTRGGNKTCECSDCGRWAYEGEQIRHSSRCDFPTAQAVTVKADRGSSIRRAAKEGTARALFSDDELVEAVRSGMVSMSDAMNQDM